MGYYEVYEQVLLTTLSGVVVIIVSICMYIFSRKFGRPAEGETFKQKLYLVQSLVSAFLIGQIVGHATIFTGMFPQTYGYLFLLGGLWALRLFESVGRGWNAVKGERLDDTASAVDVDDDFDINPKTMEQESYVSMTDVGSLETAQKEFKTQDRRRTNTKRQWMFIFLLVAMAVVVVMNGFVMVYRTPTIKLAILVCFIVNVAAQTITVFGASINAGYHITENDRRRIVLWGIVTFLWLCIVVCSTIPVLINISTVYAEYCINTPYFSAIYFFALGLLLRLSYYFEKTLCLFRARKQIIIDALVFTFGLAISGATGYWL